MSLSGPENPIRVRAWGTLIGLVGLFLALTGLLLGLGLLGALLGILLAAWSFYVPRDEVQVNRDAKDERQKARENKADRENQGYQ